MATLPLHGEQWDYVQTLLPKGHKYLTVVNDLTRGRVLYVAEDRKQESLDGFWDTLTDVQREGIEAVATDMWDPYVTSVREHVTNADKKIVFDKFHVGQHPSQAVEEVAGMLKRRFKNIITYLKHRITNATSESINAKIQWVKYTARGFRNKQNFINAIYFHCGGLDLAPVATK